MKVPCVVAVFALATMGCSFDNLENPYRGLEPAPPAEQILEDINLASFGLRPHPCYLFNAQVARCYAPDRWMGVPEGRDLMGYIHRELEANGARFWGSVDSPTTDMGAPKLPGLNMGCYFDYETGDRALRLAIVGPSGEAEPCVEGLPGDGVSQVWIVGADFIPEEHYGGVVIPDSLDRVLMSLPTQAVLREDIYGGIASAHEGYYGPVLPRLYDTYGVHILQETVVVKDGIARGLVQYGGEQPPMIPTEATGLSAATGERTLVSQEDAAATGIVVEVGLERYSLPVVVRLGESAPFEIAIPSGFDVDDLRISPGWSHTKVEWKGGQRFSGPTPNPTCAEGEGKGERPIADLVPGAGEECLVFEAQATTLEGTRIEVGAVVATFAPDGRVTEVTEPYILVENGKPATGETSVTTPVLILAWRAPSGSVASTGVWIRYVTQVDLYAN